MSVSCTYRGVLGELDRLKLQEELHGKGLAEALALVQGLEIPAVTEEDAPPIIIAGYDKERQMLFLELVGKGAYAYVHMPPEDGSEEWEGGVLLSFVKGLAYSYGAFSKFKEATSSSVCSKRVCGLVRIYWLISQYELVSIPLRRRPVPTAEDMKKRKGRKRKQQETPTPSSQPHYQQLHLF